MKRELLRDEKSSPKSDSSIQVFMEPKLSHLCLADTRKVKDTALSRRKHTVQGRDLVVEGLEDNGRSG